MTADACAEVRLSLGAYVLGALDPEGILRHLPGLEVLIHIRIEADLSPASTSRSTAMAATGLLIDAA